MDLLNARQNRRFVFAGNNGAAGHTMADHLKVVAEMPVLHHADLLAFLIGVNDLSRTLLAEGAPTTGWRRESEGRLRFEWLIAAEVPRSFPLYARLRVWQLVLSVWRQARAVPDTGEWHQQQRSKRAASPRVPLPDLTTGAQEYGDRVRSLGRLCRSLGRRCLFLTQPTLWRAGLTPEEEGTLWFGKVGSRSQMKGYVAAADLASAMDLFNQTLLQTCREDGLECYDLAAAFPKDLSVFFDDCHLNEAGARRVAQILADYLSSRPPFLPRAHF
jgi:hypothetical protein